MFKVLETLLKQCPSCLYKALLHCLTCLPRRFCQIHVKLQAHITSSWYFVASMPSISHQLGTSATCCQVANEAPHFWTFTLGRQQLEFLEDH